MKTVFSFLFSFALIFCGVATAQQGVINLTVSPTNVIVGQSVNISYGSVNMVAGTFTVKELTTGFIIGTAQ